MIPMISFASCYVYSPSGVAASSERSRLLRSLLKAADPQLLPLSAARVGQQVRETATYADLFADDVTLVPVPGSAPRPKGALWVADRLTQAIACELNAAHTAYCIWPG